MDMLINTGVLAATIRIATPLALASLGCLLCQRAGIVNLALEGFMLVGAFTSIVTVIYCGGNVWIGMLGGMAGGLLISVLFGLSVIKFRANQIMSGIAINLLGTGVTSYLLRAIFDLQGSIRATNITKLDPIKIPILEHIPVIGPAINSQSIVTYFAIVMVFVFYIVLFKTEYGLNIRSIGESEDAACTAGIKITKIKWSVVLISGLLCGLAGAFLSTTIVSEFSQSMIHGRGFNAFTAVVFGGAHPIAVWLVTLLFGYADAVGIQIELIGTGIPPSIVKMFPFILAIIALVISSGTAKYKGKGGVLKKYFSDSKQKRINKGN